MITERSFASSFAEFWQDLLPLLTPSCVHLLNAGHEEHLRDTTGCELGPVEAHPETRDAAIVTEFAYHLARCAFERGLSMSDAFGSDSIRQTAQEVAFRLVNRYEGRIVLPGTTLNDAELDEGLQLATRYEAFARIQGGLEACAFQVPIPGCGFLRACAADLVIDDFLVEVKTVKRTLAGKDIRQLIVYLALNNSCHPGIWQHAGFFNPRRSTFHRFRVQEFIGLISGGKSPVEVYTDLLEYTCSSDVQLDGVF